MFVSSLCNACCIFQIRVTCMSNNLVAMYLLVMVSIHYIRHSCLLLCLYCFIFFLAVVDMAKTIVLLTFI